MRVYQPTYPSLQTIPCINFPCHAHVILIYFPPIRCRVVLSLAPDHAHTHVQLLEVKWEDFLRAEALMEAVNNWKLAFPGEASVANLSR